VVLGMMSGNKEVGTRPGILHLAGDPVDRHVAGNELIGKRTFERKLQVFQLLIVAPAFSHLLLGVEREQAAVDGCGDPSNCLRHTSACALEAKPDPVVCSTGFYLLHDRRFVATCPERATVRHYKTCVTNSYSLVGVRQVTSECSSEFADGYCQN